MINSWKTDIVTKELFSLLIERRKEISEYLVTAEHKPELVPYFSRLAGTVDAIDEILSGEVFNRHSEGDE